MQRSKALLRAWQVAGGRAFPLGVDFTLHGSATWPLRSPSLDLVRSLSVLAAGSSASLPKRQVWAGHSGAAASTPAAAIARLAVDTALRQLHSSAASLESDRSAAVKRLAAARGRREREAPARTAGASAQPQTDLVPAATTAVTPVEGKATEVQLRAALDHSALVVTRPIEWGTVIFGYEQANKYTVYDEGGQVVALVAEDYGGIGNEIGRQLLKTRRSFTATVFSADGSQVLFRLRRPAYLVNSTMYVEDGEGNTLGEIQQRWHLLKRNYDLYMGKSQFAAITGTFLAWEFELKDSQGATLALVDRNFQGFAKEIFTDAGKYVVHFGYKGQELEQHQAAQAVIQQRIQEAQAQQQQAQAQQAQHGGPGATAVATQPAAQPAALPAAQPAAPAPPVTGMAVARTDVAVIPTVGGNQLVVARPLDLPERMVALACALTIDYDYFSQHSHHGGGLIGPPLLYPVPYPGGGDGTGGAVPGADLPGAGAAGAAAGTVGEVGDRAGADAGGEAAGSGMGGAEAMPPPRPGGQYGEGGFDSGQAWGQGGGDGEMKWDLGGDEGGGVADAAGEATEGVVGAVKSVLGGLWDLFGGGD
ncbi:hypothetical protein HYH03_000629 [Edaphochlamys debaryana]|uniref:Phospholipid scramblase n=1 Tax=Edaphochlamys debaryana TaxID=47281 RepID=A0A835YGI5_9CHLO|nr:hypothetical protein HYH03_000629 [Edaphochlamys debaryana]|eukprot:KAG2502141.1 hypothetical protein HYH03_000629 [Edaphochlamys debaryana]